MQMPLDFPLRRVAAVLVLLLTVALVAPADAVGTAQTGWIPNEARHSQPESTFADEGDDTVHDITFPLPAGSYAPLYDSYNDPRGERVHRANDVMADRLTPVHAVVDGEILFAPGASGDAKPSYGYMIRLAGDDGMFYSYVHLNDDATDGCDGTGGPDVAYAPGIERGVTVQRGQHIGWVGSSGNASCSAPHLHFEIGEDAQFTVRHNPMASLRDAERRGDFPGSTASSPPADPPPSDPDPSDLPPGSGGAGGGTFTRLAGADRLTTAVALSRETRSSARAVVIVPANSHVEALLAAPLAGLIDAPVLLSGPGGLDDAVIAEIQRLRPPSAYIIGTTEQLSEGVAQDLTAAGVRNQARVTASDRYALSAAIAEEILSYPGSSLDRAILALGDAEEANRAWPDALSASALAAATRTPILLTEGTRLPDDIADLLTAHRPDEILIVGGVAAISEDVAAEAAALASASLTRLAGATRYATSVAVADEAQRAGLRSGSIWVATGLNFPDALAAGPAAALSGSPLLLVDGLNVDGSPASTEWLGDNAGSLLVVGGSAVITDAVAGALAP